MSLLAAKQPQVVPFFASGGFGSKVNGKEVRDRDKTLKGVYRTCGMSLVKDGTKGLTIKQAKAAKNKHFVII